MFLNLDRWTPLLYVYPNWYVNFSFKMSALDFHGWSDEEYYWEQDDWNGWRDWMRPPSDTVNLAQGDCEDYALVAANWLYSNGHDGPLVFAFYFDEWKHGIPWPIGKHVTLYDGENVYSSGTIHEDTDLDEYLEESEYDYDLRRRV